MKRGRYSRTCSFTEANSNNRGDPNRSTTPGGSPNPPTTNPMSYKISRMALEQICNLQTHPSINRTYNKSLESCKIYIGRKPHESWGAWLNLTCTYVALNTLAKYVTIPHLFCVPPLWYEPIRRHRIEDNKQLPPEVTDATPQSTSSFRHVKSSV